MKDAVESVGRTVRRGKKLWGFLELLIQICEEGKKKQRRERERAKTGTKGRGLLAELSPLFLGWTLGGTKRRGDDF